MRTRSTLALAGAASGKVVVVLLELSDPSQAIPSTATLTALSIVDAGFNLAG